LAQHVVDARRIYWARVHPDNTDVVVEADAPQRSGHSHNGRVAGGTLDVVGVADLSAVTDIVEDYATPARLHPRIDQTDHVRIAEALEGPSVTPLLRSDIEQCPAWNDTGIVDQDVNVARVSDDALACTLSGHVSHRDAHRHAMLGGNFLSQVAELVLR